MKKPFFSIPRDWVLHTLITFLTGFGCALPLCLAMELTVSPAFIFLLCGGVTLACALLACMPRLRLIVYPAAALGAALMIARHAGSFPALSNALTLFLSGQPLALAVYSRAACTLLCLIFTLLASSLSNGDMAFFPLVTLCIALLFIVSFFGSAVSVYTLLPLLGALLLSARGSCVSLMRILPVSALTLCLALLLTPVSGRKNETLSSFAEQFKQAIGDYLFFTEARTTFSLSSTGWQPLGADRLGGAVSPTDTPVMQVYTSGRTLLRGTVRNTYTGHAWSDTTEQRRYLFVNPRFLNLRRDLFDQLRPSQAIRDSVLVTEPMIVSMRAPSVSTLFLTQRFTSPAGKGIVAYFSPSTEMFATRSLDAGARYTFTGSRLTGASEGVRQAVLSAHAQDDPYLPIVQEKYLSLPGSVEEQTLLLAQQIAAQADNDFDRAAALCSYLQRSFPYTLNQSKPPRSRDFVSWFLFEEQKGYCTSFASALAVMGRAIGLPTRYVEGYAVDPDEDSIARVTQEDAHAWVEIYFSGFGWLPFDPTPGTGFTPDGMNQDDPNSDESDDPPDDNDDADNPPDSAPSPTPEAEPTPTPTASPEPTPTPSPTPEHDDPAVTPTPEITPEPTSAPTPSPTQQPSPSPTPLPTPKPPVDEPPTPPDANKLFLLLLLALVMLIALKLHLCSPARATRGMRHANEAMLIWYAACVQALTAMGIPALPGEAPASYMERAQEQLGHSLALTKLGRAVCIARYSPHKLPRASLAKAEKTYRALIARMTLRQKLRFWLLRLHRGLRA